MSYVINVKNLTKSFNGKPAVCGIDLQVKKGEIFGFLGPNGSGKTTTIRMLCGLLHPDSGSGTCLGFDVIKDADKIKREIGYMTQRFSFYEDLTIRENLNFVAQAYEITNIKQAVDSAIDQLGIPKKRENQLAGELSGGWKQRLALTAAMLHHPQLLLLDEPTAGVDPKARRDFWDNIHQLSDQGITSLVSTHYMDEAERCHRLTYIANGHLLSTGTSDEVIAESNIKMWQLVGQNAYRLAHQLRELPGVLQATPFGQTLHVVGRDEALIESSLKPFAEKYRIKKAQATLEDVFICLVAEAKE